MGLYVKKGTTLHNSHYFCLISVKSCEMPYDSFGGNYCGWITDVEILLGYGGRGLIFVRKLSLFSVTLC